jgi:hypothetical protein
MTGEPTAQPELVEKLLPSTAVAERIDGLREAGLGAYLGEVIGVHEATIERWARGTIEPRSPRHYERLDNLRGVVHFLITDMDLDPNSATQWLITRSSSPPHKRPIDHIVDDPEAVMASINTRLDTQRTAKP